LFGAWEEYWKSIGGVLDEYWKSIGGVLEEYWRSIGGVLEEYWRLEKYLRQKVERLNINNGVMLTENYAVVQKIWQ